MVQRLKFSQLRQNIKEERKWKKLANNKEKRKSLELVQIQTNRNKTA